MSDNMGFRISLARKQALVLFGGLLSFTVLVFTPFSGPNVAQTRIAQADQYQQMLNRYCVVCHSEQLPSAGLILPQLSLDSISAEAETWEKVVRKLHTRAMPPLEMPRPDETVYEGFIAFLENVIDAAGAENPNPGRVATFHRLNRTEYSNAIRDILDLDYDSSALLPPDDSGYGFDNIADVLSVSPMLTERYLAAARKISQLAVGDLEIGPATEIFEVDKLLRQSVRVSEDLPFSSRGGHSVRHYFPVDGEYVVRIFFLRTYNGVIRGLHEPNELELRVNGKRVQQISVGRPIGEESGNGPNVDGVEVRFFANAGPSTIGVNFIGDSSLAEGMRRPHYAITSYEYAGDRAEKTGIARIELRGPYGELKRGDTSTRKKIFVCRPQSTETQDEELCATQIIDNIGRLAYRQTLSDLEIQTLLGAYRAGRQNQDFDAGIEMAIRRILVSPKFLFRQLNESGKTPSADSYQISDLELASRLSFFLWSSIPDEQLLDLAESGQLRVPGTLEGQISRMLADSKSDALITNFTEQWLHLRNIQLVSPDPIEFDDFDLNLRQAMQEETKLFLQSQFRENKSVTELLTADYTFLNQRLAKHYDIDGIYGTHFRRVDLNDESRMGLLGKASILTVTSYAHRTSPVVRGKWLLENVYGTPPPPPPPDIPALSENEDKNIAPLSVRARMELHRSNSVCASCHKVMDPLGFALENFDGIGRWRSINAAGGPIDAGGMLANGIPVDGPITLRNALVSAPEVFTTTVAQKLLTYALGRGVEYYDAPSIRRIVRESADENYSWAALITGIINSTPFQMRNAL
tara:strand:- start:403 stop:2823 length:2421 start_codon:yes stop_codon:yes gene_type:complete